MGNTATKEAAGGVQIRGVRQGGWRGRWSIWESVEGENNMTRKGAEVGPARLRC